MGGQGANNVRGNGAKRGVGLVAHSPLANGALLGRGAAARKSRGKRGGDDESVRALVDAYEDVAGMFGMDLVDLALGFVRTRWFVTSVCVRAQTADALGTTLAQLYDAEVTGEALDEVERVARLERVVEDVDRGRRRWSQEL